MLSRWEGAMQPTHSDPYPALRGTACPARPAHLRSDRPSSLTQWHAECCVIAWPGSTELSNACWVVTSVHVL